MNTISKNQPSKSDKRKTPISIIDGIGRVLVCCGLICGLGFLLVAIQGMWRPTPAATKPIPKLSLADVANGHWTFRDLPWNVATREITAQTVDTVLTSESTFDLEATPSDDFAYSFLQMLVPTVEEGVDQVTYRFDSPSLRLVGFASAQRPKSIQEIRVAMRNTPPQWTYVHATRAVAGEPPKKDIPYLLPAAGIGNRLAARVNAKNEVWAELIDLSARLTDVRNVWLEQGWNIRSLDEGKNGNPVLLCQKEEKAIVACLVGSSEQDPGMLLTVLSPSFSESQGKK